MRLAANELPELAELRAKTRAEFREKYSDNDDYEDAISDVEDQWRKLDQAEQKYEQKLKSDYAKQAYEKMQKHGKPMTLFKSAPEKSDDKPQLKKMNAKVLENKKPKK